MYAIRSYYDAGHQLGGGHRLLQPFGNLEALARRFEAFVDVAGEHHHRRGDPLAAHRVDEFEAVHAAHPPVGKDQVVGMFLREPELV